MHFSDIIHFYTTAAAVKVDNNSFELYNICFRQNVTINTKKIYVQLNNTQKKINLLKQNHIVNLEISRTHTHTHDCVESSNVHI